MKLVESDKSELLKFFPNLNCELNNQRIWGELKFCCWYDSRLLHHNSEHNDSIADDYEIEIKFNKKDTFNFPKVYEKSFKIENLVKKQKIKIQDLHVESDGSCCLGIFPTYQWVSVYDFILKKVIPFFYWQSFRRNKGVEPWKGYSHGNAGIQEAITSFKESDKGENRNKPCHCGSGIKYKKCCFENYALNIENLTKKRL